MQILLFLVFLMTGSTASKQQAAKALKTAKRQAKSVMSQYKASQQKISLAKITGQRMTMRVAKVAAALSRSAATGVYKQIVSASCPQKRPLCCLKEDLWLPQRTDDLSPPSSCARVKTFFCDGTSPEDYMAKMGRPVKSTGTYGDCSAGTRDMCPVVQTVNHTATCSSAVNCYRTPLSCKGADCNIGRHIGLVVKYACVGKKPPQCGTVANFKGTAWIKEGKKGKWRKLKRGEAIPFRASIRTGRRSSLMMKMANGAIITMGSRSTANMTNVGNCSKSEPKKNRSLFDLITGTIHGTVTSWGKGRQVEIGTYGSWCGIRGTKFSVSIKNEGGRKVIKHTVTKGTVEVINRFTGKRTLLKARRSLTIRPKKGQKPVYTSTTYDGLLRQIKGKSRRKSTK